VKPASSGKTRKSYQKERIKKKKKIYFIYVTFGSLNEAKRLGGKLVKNKLAACTNIIPTIYSTSAFSIDFAHIDFQKWINEQTKS
jgi:hypothetical protein